MAYIRKMKGSLIKVDSSTYVGEDSYIFYDVETGSMRISDGVTPGGLPVIVQGIAATTDWGNLTGTITDQTDLISYLDTNHAKLDGGGKLLTSQLPSIALTDVFVVADIAARNALTVQSGDVAKVLDSGTGMNDTYIYDGTQWLEIRDTSLSTQVIIPNIPGSQLLSVQHQLDYFHSTGVISGGIVTDNGDGTINVSSGKGFVRLSTDPTDVLYTIEWLGTNLGPFDNTRKYFIEVTVIPAGDPINGVAQVQAIPDTRPNDLEYVHLAQVMRENTRLHMFQETQFQVGDHAKHMIRRLEETAPFRHAEGAAIGEVGTRNIVISAGAFWQGLTRFTTSAIDTSATNIFEYYHSDGAGGWTEISSATQIDNLNYDDGSGTLAALSVGNYGVHWVYLAADTHGTLYNEVFVLYGTGDYTLQEAQDAQPGGAPEWVDFHTALIGKIIIQQGATNFTSVQNTFTSVISPTAVADHNNLLNIGTYTHVQLDAHMDNTSNPHGTSIVNLTDTDGAMVPLNNYHLWYNATNTQWEARLFDHANLANIGTNTHAQIDTHIADTANPHSTSLPKLTDVNPALAPLNNYHLFYNGISAQWETRLFSHLNISDSGTYTHTQIDTHIDNLNNPHQTTLKKLTDVDSGMVPLNNYHLWYNLTNGRWEARLFDHANLANIGTNTHAQIDTHIADTANPHGTSIVNLTDTDGTMVPADNHHLWYNGISAKWETRVFDHLNLANIGTNTHAQIDAHMGSTANPHNTSLPKLTDVDPALSPLNNYHLWYNATNTRWETRLFDHINLANAGAYTHAQIDSHINNSANPHATTLPQLGDVFSGIAPVENHHLWYNGLNSRWETRLFDHVNLANKGTNTHAQIDTHIADTANPHSTSLSKLTDVDPTLSPGANYHLWYNSTSTQWETRLFDHANLANIGTNTHAQIDTHIADTANPHSTSLPKLTDVNPALAPGDNYHLWYSITSGQWETRLFDHVNLANKGTNTHAQIDTHIADTANPHSTSLSKLTDVDPALIPANNYHLWYNSTSTQWEARLFDHANLANIGTNTHAQIDTHIADTANPHSTSLPKLTDVDPGLAPNNNEQLFYNSVTARWEARLGLAVGSATLVQTASGTIAANSGTTNILQSTLAPTILDGTQMWSTTFTPSTTGSIIRIRLSCSYAVTNASSELVIAIFNGTTCIGTMIDTASSSGGYQTLEFTIEDPSVVVVGVPIVYQARVGRNGGNATWYINTNAAAENMGGTLSNHSWTIDEVIST